MKVSNKKSIIGMIIVICILFFMNCAYTVNSVLTGGTCIESCRKNSNLCLLTTNTKAFVQDIFLCNQMEMICRNSCGGSVSSNRMGGSSFGGGGSSRPSYSGGYFPSSSSSKPSSSSSSSSSTAKKPAGSTGASAGASPSSSSGRRDFSISAEESV
jgi:hypothetical protein